MKVPQMKSEAAVSQFNVEWRWINFNATQDAATEFARFGDVRSADMPEAYTLIVDARYDLMEVVTYINAYGKPEK